jgi:hypothetical protein
MLVGSLTSSSQLFLFPIKNKSETKTPFKDIPMSRPIQVELMAENV